MKIAICGSMNFERKILAISDQLEEMGHQITVPFLTKKIIGKKRHDQLKIEKDLIKYYFKQIQKNDAILVTNFDKKGIKGYIGGNTLVEIGFAYILNKKIFLLNPIPNIPFYRLEIKTMKPVVLYGSLNKIK
jgi:hypothetical protein